MILVAASAVSIAQTGQRDTRTASEILALLAKTYHDCKSYADSGVVRTIFVTPDGGTRTADKPFKTAFVRPDRFRFEFEDKGPGGDQSIRYIVWRQGA
jgi:hypothetical protein